MAADQSAMEWLTTDRHPDLLPLAWLSGAGLEDFTEALLVASRLLPTSARRVDHVERWGVSGDAQDGIDFFGRFSDGTRAAWQCKQVREFGPARVRRAVEAMTFTQAEEVYLFFSGVATAAARNEMLLHESWTLVDRRGITETVRLLPRTTQADLIDRFWGREIRRHFVGSASDTFISVQALVAQRSNPDVVMNDLGSMVGRENELNLLREALGRDGASRKQIVLVRGPAGRGKTRLVCTALEELSERDPTIAVACLRPGRVPTPDSLDELETASPVAVFVDDAHIDPSSLRPLLEMARSDGKCQLILALRPSASAAVRAEISAAQFSLDERAVVDVEELSLPSARDLVRGLAGGADLPFGLRNYLAGEATHSPHVAVVAVNLINRGRLNRNVSVDEDLRELVLSRYQDLLVPSYSEPQRSAALLRLLAVTAALAPVSFDGAIAERVAQLCGVSVVEMAGRLNELTDAGVIVGESAQALRVVPDLLADRALDMASVSNGVDTGFVSEVWEAFGSTHPHRLALSLGELQWRQMRIGGPEVLSGMWKGVRERFQSRDFNALCDELDQIGQLASTQAVEMVSVLEDLRERLDKGNPSEEFDHETPVSGQRRMWFRRRTQEDVRARLPELYARAAVNEPAVLETALDALWALRQRDQRPPNSNPNHAERMVADHLASLATCPDPTYPMRIVARVEAWASEPYLDSSPATPLFALKPLLAKEELETSQNSIRSLQFESHLISAEAMRPVRDAIREVLSRHGAGPDARLAGESVSLLKNAIGEPHGYFGRPVDDDARLAWEGDDLASLKCLEHIATTTTFAAVRQIVLRALTWPAEHATSVLVQHEAMRLSLLISGFAELEDELAGFLVNPRWDRETFIVERLPSVDELVARRSAEQAHRHQLSDDEKQAEDMARIRARVDRETIGENDLAARLVEGVFSGREPDQVLRMLDRAAEEAAAVSKRTIPSYWGLWRALEDQDPSKVGVLVMELAPVGSRLDGEISSLLEIWFRHDPDAAVGWMKVEAAEGRQEVRASIARGFARSDWIDLYAQSSEIWEHGIEDPDESIAQAFLAGAHSLVRENPTRYVPLVLQRGITNQGAGELLNSLCRYDGSSVGQALSVDDAAALLPLVARAGLEDYVVQELLAGVSRNHPRLILDFLAAEHGSGRVLDRSDLHSLRPMCGSFPVEVAEWFVNQASDPESAGMVLDVVAEETFPPAFSQRLLDQLDAGSSLTANAVIDALAGVSMWTAHNPLLAQAILSRAKTPELKQRLLEALSSTRIMSWMTTDGVSPELNEAHELLESAASTVTDASLRAWFAQEADRIGDQIDELARRHEQDAAEDW